VSEIEIPFIETSREMIERWSEGEFDVLTVWNLTIAEASDTLFDLIPDLHTRYVGFCVDKPPFSNAHVRKAFSHAVDREALLRDVDSERASTRGGAIPPAMPGHSHRVGPEYDPETAKQLLAEAGYPEGRGLPELNMLVPPWLIPTAKLLAEQAAEIGFRIAYHAAEGKFWSASLENEHLWVSGFGADYPDPDGFFRGLLDWRFRGVVDRVPEIRTMYLRARSSAEHDERLRSFQQIDRMLVSELAVLIPVAYPRSTYLVRPWVHGLEITPITLGQFDRVSVDAEERARATGTRDEETAAAG
jgi:oligopeptide transport system substrate-binding protein